MDPSVEVTERERIYLRSMPAWSTPPYTDGSTIADKIDRMLDIIERQESAILGAIVALNKLAAKGSINKSLREATIDDLVKARNEKLRPLY